MSTKRSIGSGSRVDSSARPGLSRRAVLRGAVAAPFVISAAALGKGEHPAASERITIGVIGTGGRGTADMQAMLSFPQAQVVAVCDTFTDRRERARGIVRKALAGKSGLAACKAHADWREVVGREDVDAVVIATQDHWHALIAVAAAKAGKDIYGEKPHGVAVTQGRAIVDAVRRYGRIYQTGTQQRSARNFRFACELARNGYLGKVHTLKVAAPGPTYKRRYKGPTTAEPVPKGFDYDMYLGPAPKKPYNRGRHDWPGWYLIWDYCAGFVVNWGVHHLDIAHWGCPAIGREAFDLTCKATYRHDGLTDNINDWQAEYAFAGGVKMSFSDSGHPHKQGCRFEGDKGWVHVNRAGIWAGPESLLKVEIKPGDERLGSSRHHQGNFLECVRTRKDPISPVEAGHTASLLGMVADIAARVGREVKWDPKTEKFLGDDEANRQLARPMRSPWSL